MKALDFFVEVFVAFFFSSNFSIASPLTVIDEPVGPAPAWHHSGPMQSYPMVHMVPKEADDGDSNPRTDYDIHSFDDKKLIEVSNSLPVSNVIRDILATAVGHRREYLARVIPEAVKVGVAFNIPPSGIVGMSIYESNYGTSHLATRYQNYLGMKAQPTRWNGSVAPQMPTIDSGRHVRADFRAYADLPACILGFVEFLRETGRYESAFHTTEGGDFVKILHKRGYCPDDDYVENVNDIIVRHKLEILDPLAKELNAKSSLPAYNPEDGTLRQLVIRAATLEVLNP